MEFKILSSYLRALTSYSLADSAVFDPESGRGCVTVGSSNYPFAIKEKGFAIAGSVNKAFFCENPEPVLTKVLSSELFGTKTATFSGKTYNSATVYPVAVQSDAVKFSTASGKQFVVSSDNCRVTLGLYDLLYSRNGEHSVLMLPELLPSGGDNVAIASSKVAECFCTLRSESLGEDFAHVYNGKVICPGDVTQYASINQALGDYSTVGTRAPAVEDVLQSAKDLVLSSNKEGYTLSGSISFDGVTYYAEKNIRPSLALVQSCVSKQNETMESLASGVILSKVEPEVLAELCKNSISRKDRGSLHSSTEVQTLQEAKAFWGLPVQSSLKTTIWGF